jgi:hypothetical protein
MSTNESSYLYILCCCPSLVPLVSQQGEKVRSTSVQLPDSHAPCGSFLSRVFWVGDDTAALALDRFRQTSMAFIGPSPRPHIDVTMSGKRSLSSSVVVLIILCCESQASTSERVPPFSKRSDAKIHRHRVVISLRIAVLFNLTQSPYSDCEDEASP